jgi:hypothetical protein
MVSCDSGDGACFLQQTTSLVPTRFTHRTRVDAPRRPRPHQQAQLDAVRPHHPRTGVAAAVAVGRAVTGAVAVTSDCACGDEAGGVAAAAAAEAGWRGCVRSAGCSRLSGPRFDGGAEEGLQAAPAQQHQSGKGQQHGAEAADCVCLKLCFIYMVVSSGNREGLVACGTNKAAAAADAEALCTKTSLLRSEEQY